MPKIDPKAVLRAAARYVKENPSVARRVAINAVAMKITVPLDVLRYLVAKNAGKKNAPKDVVLETQAPSLRAAASVNAMGTPLRVGASVRVEEVRISTEEIWIDLRLSDVLLRLEGASESPIAALLKSGALDLSKPGNLARYMPNRPAALVEAEDDRLVLDLMKVDKIAQNPRVMRILELVTPVLGIKSVKTDEDAIVIALSPKPSGVPTVIERVRSRISGRH